MKDIQGWLGLLIIGAVICSIWYFHESETKQVTSADIIHDIPTGHPLLDSVERKQREIAKDPLKVVMQKVQGHPDEPPKNPLSSN
jgi:hypothetical protein